MKWLIDYPNPKLIKAGEMHIHKIATDAAYEEIVDWMRSHGNMALVSEMNQRPIYAAYRVGDRMVDCWKVNRWPRLSKIDRARRFDLYDFFADKEWRELTNEKA